jgi:hypothetical protein
MHGVLEAIQGSAPSLWLTSDGSVVAANSKQILETLHFIALALQIGAIMALSLRLAGVGRGVSIAALGRPVFRTAWVAFAVVFVTGVLQFMPIATEVFYRPSFRAKLALLAAAIAVLVWLQAAVRRGAAAWDVGAAVPKPVKLAAALSLALWPAVIVVARLMYALVQMSGT